MPAVFRDTQPGFTGIFRKPRGREYQVHLRHRLAALPEPDAVVDHVNSSRALDHLIGREQLAEMTAHLPGIEGKR